MHIDFFDDHNICVIPVYPKSKRPKPSEWQKRRAERNSAGEFESSDNVGVVLGTASGGLVDIDLDSDLARQLAPYFLPTTGGFSGVRALLDPIIFFEYRAIPGRGESLISEANLPNIVPMGR